MFWRLRNTLTRFMAGRYGTDALNRFLFGVYFVLWIISWIFRRGVIAAVVCWLAFPVLLWLVFRTLSRNIVKRQSENERFLRWWVPTKAWFRRQFDRVRDIRRWRYRRCPYCRAYLRLPIRRGRRTVTCFRCGGRFGAFFL